MSQQFPQIVPSSVIQTLRNCDGVYEAFDKDGVVKGPIVGYAGGYPGPDGKEVKFVGEVYYNVAKGDQWPHISYHWAAEHAEMLKDLRPDLLVAAPMGGISYMSVLKQALNCRGIFAEKKVIEVAGEGTREKSKLLLGRYEVEPGDGVILIEDIVNNFSTTKELVTLVESARARVLAIACVINRSDMKTYWQAPERDPMAVVALEHKPTPQYRQDDPAVAAYIAAGKFIPKPKDHWDELKRIEAEYV